MKVLDQKSGENWVLYNGDSCEILAGIPTASIHYSITSIPFASLYTYSMEILHKVEDRVMWWFNAKLARLECRLKGAGEDAGTGN